jgi:hypothetical protein
MANPSEQPGFLKLDFARFFPHKFWISTWSKDGTYPNSFRYKVLSARDEKKAVIELVLLLEEEDGTKQEMHRAQVRLAVLDGYARVFVEGLEQEHGIEFEEQDFSDVQSIAEFERAMAEYGWSDEEPES